MLGNTLRTISPRVARFFVAITVFLLLAGCAMRLAYNTLDFWIPYYLSDFVNLDSKQELIFDNELRKALMVHRRKELPKLHRLLYDLQPDLGKPLTYTQIRDYHFRFTAIGQDTMTLMAEPLAAMLSQLDGQQIAQLNNQIKSEIEKRRQDRAILTTKQKVNKRSQALEDASLFWVGSLTRKQKILLSEMAGYQVEMESVFFFFWTDFLDNWRLLMEDRGKPHFQAELSKVLQRLVAFENDKVQAELNFYLNRRFDVIRRLNNSLSAGQRKYFERRLTDIRKNIAVLINQ
ncbi:DUF6279 family lipoprotein [uncultured Photobacterium sp.]|uniref:DUF6279 family lipoprotein n=1 Tax=uncultured Photobacterium sp. TaxID=173973 RepID=UPI00260B00DE|nr:DUF6279 family lipoprotein [uncultured Photobacterium sp.]